MAIAAASVASPARAATILVDFGATGTQTTTDTQSRTWNNITDANDQATNFVLNKTVGGDSGYRLTITNPPGTTNAVGFNGSNANGTTSPTGTAASRGYPVSATSDSLYGNTATFGVGIVQAVRLTLSNLSPTETYSLDFFASRIGAGGDNRQTEYAVTGAAGTTSVFLNASENTGTVVGVSGVAPVETSPGSGQWQIVVNIDGGPANNNASGFYYLGVLEVNSAVPEPGAVGAVGLAVTALLARRRAARR